MNEKNNPLIPIDKIKDFPNHPFRVERDDKMEEMVNSIKNEDVVHPVIVRQKCLEKCET